MTVNAAELITMLNDHRQPGEDYTETLGRLLEERERLRKAARQYVEAVENDETPALYITFRGALGEPVV